MKKTICNKCGKEFGDTNLDFNSDFSIHTRIGYGSKYDMCGLALDLCSSCMDELIDSCVLSPVIDYEAQWVQQDDLRSEGRDDEEVGGYGF